MGRPFLLLPWQRAFINDLYRVRTMGDAYELQYKWALLGIPKKNGKSALASALALYHLVGDPDIVDPWVVCGATSKAQAGLVFNGSKRMCELSEPLGNMVVMFKDEIRRREGYGKLTQIAKAGGRNDGMNISFAVLDELHEWDEDNWTIVTNGTVGRDDAQIVQITTAGFDLDTVCGREYLKGRAIERGEIDNPTYLFRWYGIPESEKVDHRDPEIWARANPSYGTLVSEDALRDKAHNTHESAFRRYFLNQWVKSGSTWLPSGAWDACRDDAVAALVPGEKTWVGWDASTRRDSTAVVAVQWVDGAPVSAELRDAVDAAKAAIDVAETEGDEEQVDPLALVDRLLQVFLSTNSQRLRVHSRVWARPRLPDGKLDENWRLPTGEVERYVRSLALTYDVEEVAYDPMFITWSATALESQGLEMVEFPQTDGRMCPATKTAYDMIVGERIAHDGDSVLEQHIDATAVIEARNGGQRASKARQSAQMDAAIALIMAVYRAVKSALDFLTAKTAFYSFGYDGS